MHRRMSAVLLALSLTGTLLVGAGSAVAATPQAPGAVGNSQAEPPDGGDPGPGGDPGGSGGSGCDDFRLEPCWEGPDAGGTGTGDPLGRPSAEEAANTVAAIRSAVRSALVTKPGCFDLLSPDDSRAPGTRNPVDVIGTVPIRYVDDGEFTYIGGADGVGTSGNIDVYNGFFLVNFARGLRFPGWIDLQAYFELPDVQVTFDDLRIVALLHEVGHLTGVNVHPEGDTGRDFNTRVYVYCLEQGAIYQ